MKSLTLLKFLNITVAALIIVAMIRVSTLPTACVAEPQEETTTIVIEAVLVRVSDEAATSTSDELESSTEATSEKSEAETSATKAVVIEEDTTTSQTEAAKQIKETDITDSNEYYSESDITMLCKVTYGEAGSLSKLEQAAVVWCILNRVDSSVYPDTIAKVITQPYQFYGYSESKPINDTTKSVVLDVLSRWVKEKQGETNVGRVLPIEYMYFTGDGIRNTFRLSSSSNSQAWDWSLPNPYEN